MRPSKRSKQCKVCVRSTGHQCSSCSQPPGRRCKALKKIPQKVSAPLATAGTEPALARSQMTTMADSASGEPRTPVPWSCPYGFGTGSTTRSWCCSSSSLDWRTSRSSSAVSSVAPSRARDKLRALQVLARERVGVPVTGFGNPVAKSPAIEDNKHVVADQQGATYARDL